MKNSMNKETVLVTGGTGFLGTHLIVQLLQNGYKVKTTIRDLNRVGEIETVLTQSGLKNADITYIKADLNKDENWDIAISDSKYVLHVASPLPISNPIDESEIIEPAQNGTVRILKASRDAGVKRVVITSSFAAVGYTNNSKNHVFTESDWTNPNTDLDPYIKSKTLAELAAWNFIKKEGGNLELSVVNPVGIFGPPLNNDFSLSINLIKDLMEGKMVNSPNFSFGIIDVRDVVDLHLKAMTHPNANGERFIATADGIMTFYDIAQLLLKNRKQHTDKMANLSPNEESVYISISNQKSKTILDWKPRTKEEAILATVDYLAKFVTFT